MAELHVCGGDPVEAAAAHAPLAPPPFCEVERNEEHHEQTVNASRPVGVVVDPDAEYFQLRIDGSHGAYSADQFVVWNDGAEFNEAIPAALLPAVQTVAKAVVLVEQPLPNGQDMWTGSGTLVKIPAKRREVLGLDSADADVLAVWTNWHVAHYPADGHPLLPDEYAGRPGTGMSVLVDYTVGLKPFRVSAGGEFAIVEAQCDVLTHMQPAKHR